MEHLIDSRGLHVVRAKLQRSSYPSIQLPNMQNHVVGMLKSYLKERHDQILLNHNNKHLCIDTHGKA